MMELFIMDGRSSRRNGGRPWHVAVPCDTIQARVPAMLDVHLVLDNSSTHKTPAIHPWLARHPRFHLHVTPTGATWISLVERSSAGLTEKQLRRGVHRSTRELEASIRRYSELTNGQPRPFVWTKTAKSSRAWPVSVIESLTQDTRAW